MERVPHRRDILKTGFLVVAAPGVYVPDGLYPATPNSNEPVPTADHGILLCRNQVELLPDMQLGLLADPEDGMVGVHGLYFYAGGIIHSWHAF
jgi:hypothetical protein